jgi:hypothetical protein
LEENPTNEKKLLKAVKEFRSSIEVNQSFIPNYSARYRHKETISTAFVESTVNYVVSKRFVVVSRHEIRGAIRAKGSSVEASAPGLFHSPNKAPARR